MTLTHRCLMRSVWGYLLHLYGLTFIFSYLFRYTSLLTKGIQCLVLVFFSHLTYCLVISDGPLYATDLLGNDSMESCSMPLPNEHSRKIFFNL